MQAAASLLLCVCTSCSGGGSGGSTPEPEPAEPSSEKAMDNFVAKLDAGNYVIDAADYLKTTVASKDQVVFDYYNEGLEDTALVSLNDETFEVTLSADAVIDTDFVSAGNALAKASDKLPNSWAKLSGNMFDLFYGSADDPLVFTSKEDIVKMTLLNLIGYGQNALTLTHDITMTLDKEDPSSVNFKAVVDDDVVARHFFDDIDLTVSFGTAQGDPRVDAWIKNPVYPETKTAWDDKDLFYLNSVFLPGYGKDVLPFPEFASYALTFDDEVFGNSEKILLKDIHASEKNVEAYKEALVTKGGYQPVKAGDETIFRKQLRPEYNSYASVKVYYDNGFTVAAERYYDLISYHSLDEVNAAVKKYGFPELPADDLMKDIEARDTWADRSESWLYFFDYDMYLLVKVNPDSEETLRKYLAGYEEQLKAAGYTPTYIGAGVDQEPQLDYYGNASGSAQFKYGLSEDGSWLLTFRHEKEISAEKGTEMVKAAGFPEVKFQENFFARDIARYHYYTRAFQGRIYLSCSQPFKTEADAQAFLDGYIKVLEDAGFYYFNPENIGSLKSKAYYDETNDMFFAYDFYTNDAGAVVSMDFVRNN